MSQKKKNTKKGTKRTSLTLSLALIIFGAFIIVFALSLLAIFILSRFNVIQSGDGKIDITDAVLFFLVFILGVGGIFSFVISKLALIPINKTILHRDLSLVSLAAKFLHFRVLQTPLTS